MHPPARSCIHPAMWKTVDDLTKKKRSMEQMVRRVRRTESPTSTVAATDGVLSRVEKSSSLPRHSRPPTPPPATRHHCHRPK